MSCGGCYEIRNDVWNWLLEMGNEVVLSVPDFRKVLEAHFNRLPASYLQDVNIDRVEDVLLHQKLLAEARDPEKRPAFHVRLLEHISTESWRDLQSSSASKMEPSDSNAISLSEPSLVIKVADFGVARFQSQGGVMTAETGKYRWMAPKTNYNPSHWEDKKSHNNVWL